MLKGWASGRGTLAGQGGDRVSGDQRTVLGLITTIKHPFMVPPDHLRRGSNYQCKIFNGRIGWKISAEHPNLLKRQPADSVKANPVTIGDLKTRTSRVSHRRGTQLAADVDVFV